MRKNLGDVQAQDLLLKYRYESSDGFDVYEIHAVADYRVGAIPFGQLVYNPKVGMARTHLRKELEGQRLQALGVDHGGDE